jgi:hypothetical protein
MVCVSFVVFLLKYMIEIIKELELVVHYCNPNTDVVEEDCGLRSSQEEVSTRNYLKNK